MTASTQVHHQPRLLGGAATFVLGLILAFAVMVALGVTLGRIAPAAPSTPASDGSYGVVEKARAQFGVGADSSYDAVEKTRIGGPFAGPAPAVDGDRRLPELQPR